MSRRAGRAKLCPTPSKASYWTDDEAAIAAERFERQMIRAGRDVTAFYVYSCACQRFHLTHLAFGQGGRPNRRVSA